MSAHSSALPTQRADLIGRLKQNTHYDLAIVGGGATGLGVALEAASRGLRVVLLESHDFAKGTSSRATKLLHGGVRYLAQGRLALVREALMERATILRNAPHLAQPLALVMPSYRCWETPFYGLGLSLYDRLAGPAGLGKTRFLGHAATRQALPRANPTGLKGGVMYWDAQFNDARLALTLAKTAALHGALLVNYCRVTDLAYDAGQICGLVGEDAETGEQITVRAGCVVNAAGVWVDELRQKDNAASAQSGLARPGFAPMVAPSQGVHLVVERHFLGSDVALLVPRTADGRVLFAIPWLGKVILGTTDSPRHDLAREPVAFAQEVDFILTEAARYLTQAPTRADVKSLWVGLRPLVKPPHGDGENSKSLSREHTVLISRSGLVTVTGGKWTTYRAMAEDLLQHCLEKKLIPSSNLPPSLTARLPLLGADEGAAPQASLSQAEGLHGYGSERHQVQALPGCDSELAPGLSQAMVRYAVRHEYARTVEDMLARRNRCLFLDAALAIRLAPRVAAIMQEETGRSPQLAEFLALARQYGEVPV